MAGADSPSTPSEVQGTASELEEAQEKLLREKYGALIPKIPPRLLAKRQSKKCFDSADWSMNLQKRAEIPQDTREATLADMLGLRDGSTELLPAKLSPTPAPPRRLSHLGDS